MTMKTQHVNIYPVQLKQCYGGKGIMSSVYIRKEKSPKIHSLSFQHKKLKPVKNREKNESAERELRPSNTPLPIDEMELEDKSQKRNEKQKEKRNKI